MRKRLGFLAVIALLCGLAAGGLGLWLHYGARERARSSRELQDRSLELEEQSDAARGRPDEERLLRESQRYGAEAQAALDFARRSSRLALFSGIGSIVLILASVALIIINLRGKEADRS